MKKFVAGVMMGFMASCALAFATAETSHNGNFWVRLNHSAKDGYVIGYADAMRVSVTKLEYLNGAADLFHWKGARKIVHELAKQLSMNELTPQRAVKQLNQLYSNDKYSELDVGQAIQALAMRARETAIPETPAKTSK
ncbi:MAG: hypothetical protein ACREQI_08450 [Candidatus Binataceae bacterium]